MEKIAWFSIPQGGISLAWLRLALERQLPLPYQFFKLFWTLQHGSLLLFSLPQGVSVGGAVEVWSVSLSFHSHVQRTGVSDLGAV